jgi:hypothetical protein
MGTIQPYSLCIQVKRLLLMCTFGICLGKFDNGGRFDLRLPYADQGYVDEVS